MCIRDRDNSYNLRQEMEDSDSSLLSLGGGFNPVWHSFTREACNDIKGSVRKNVNKFLVRKTLTYILKDSKKYAEYVVKNFSIKEEEFSRIHEVCIELKNQERVRDSGKIKKDYGRVVNEIIADPQFHCVFNKILEEVLNEFKRLEFGNITKKNRKVYSMTVELLYKYSSNVLREQNKSIKKN
eukprot:TRINITY_DN13002_c0_g1_i3.p1 TRINITY_DN13002_c0_g1~~TRINITY_DN13002_c0_g1_i3.p1  ORF type:complete len:183 (+),score=44.30 TRINITY_DN13002_c0_g1_i3:71-619(+)